MLRSLSKLGMALAAAAALEFERAAMLRDEIRELKRLRAAE